MMPNDLKDKRIILIFGSFDLGGAERQGLYLAEALQQVCGAEVEVWGLSNEPGRLSQLCQEKGIAWRGVKCGWGRFAATRIVKLARFALLLRLARPDAVLSYTRLPNLICSLTWRLSGAGCYIWNQRDEGLLLTKDFWNRLAVRMTPCFLSNSLNGKLFLERTYGVASEKVTVIPNGIARSSPLQSRSVWRERLGVAEDRFVACMVANSHPYKDHRTLLSAWGALQDRLPAKGARPVLLLAGRVDSGRQELEDVAAELGIAEQVRFLGKVDDVAGLLQASDLCVHSSVSEGLPNAVLEAMAAGVPVVGTDIPGIREALGPEGSRFLAPIGDAQGMSSLIYDFMADEGLRLKARRMLLERVENSFSLGKMCDLTSALIGNNL